MALIALPILEIQGKEGGMAFAALPAGKVPCAVAESSVPGGAKSPPRRAYHPAAAESEARPATGP
jgi:hypothetical protein